MNQTNRLPFWIIFFFSVITIGGTAHAAVGKWRRSVIALPNNTYSGNPFEVEVDGIFTHTTSGTTITLPGYYAGNDTWKIGFMPTEIGEWTYVTSSADSDLNGRTGTINCDYSGHQGMLRGDKEEPDKWKFDDGPYVVPIAFRFDLFQENGTLSRFTEIADFIKNDVNGHMLEFTFRNEVFTSNWQDHQFNLPLWDRLEERMEVLTARGLGIHFMLYSDDVQAPKWSARSSTEQLLIRYTVARLAGYPVVWFNTGIDIAEYRDQSWVNWYGEQVRSLDPYGHPVSSRYGGGSGNLVMSGQTWDSRGDRQAYINDMRNYFTSAIVPVSMDDAWMENGPSSYDYKNFRPEDIRRALWKCVAGGGLGALIRGSVLYNNDLWFRMSNFEQDLESEQWLKLVNPFIQNELGATFGVMIPDQSLVSNGHCLADPARTKILYFLMGENDKWDSGDGGPVTVKLSALEENYYAEWFDPRTGKKTVLGTLQGGAEHIVNPPNTDDWLLLLNMVSGTLPPAPPTALRIIDVK